MTTTAWYYEYYEPGSFPHQEILCETVVWTKYNLEGQIATETSLSPSAGNPLTIRLLAVRAALCQLTDYVGKLDSEIKAVTKNQLETKKFVGMRGTYYGKGSQANTGAAPMEVIKFDGEAKEFEIQHIIIQSALNGFFTNF